MPSLYIVLYQFGSATNAKNFVANNSGIDATPATVTFASGIAEGSWVVTFPENLNQLPSGFSPVLTYNGNTQMYESFAPFLDLSTINVITIPDGTPVIYRGVPVTNLANGPASGVTGSWVPGQWNIQYIYPQGIFLYATMFFTTPSDQYTQVPWGVGVIQNDGSTEIFVSSVTFTSFVLQGTATVFQPPGSTPLPDGTVFLVNGQPNGSNLVNQTFSGNWGGASGTVDDTNVYVTLPPGDGFGQWTPTSGDPYTNPGFNNGQPLSPGDGFPEFSASGLSSTYRMRGSTNTTDGTYGAGKPGTVGELFSLCDGAEAAPRSDPSMLFWAGDSSYKVTKDWDWTGVTVTAQVPNQPDMNFAPVAGSAPNIKQSDGGILGTNPFYALFQQTSSN